ncbi:peroxiredoxin-like 2C isoform X1 [Synchiropus splendidus]|uniref:peroxiredoxin-like 2C isoform X1 n=1 Tax=Synchiropus splendidus TaxID=270530 RepID=UPI00237E0F15|nr:peroxiredoxin-like 2C isoform X1 [Synchiropus splendidus]
MAEAQAPITRQIFKDSREFGARVDVSLQDVDDCFIYDRHGTSVAFKKLYENRKSIIIFLRSFLCYTCKEYVDDLSKIPRDVLEEAGVTLVLIGQSAYHHIEPFSSLTGCPYEIFVDPERCIYRKLGMKTEEEFTMSGTMLNEFTPSSNIAPKHHHAVNIVLLHVWPAHTSPHVKSGIFLGQMKSIWRAMTSPAFDFQGDLHQQGGAIIAGPGSKVHFCHISMNRLDHMPIDWLLQLAGVHETVDFSGRPKIIHV